MITRKNFHQALLDLRQCVKTSNISNNDGICLNLGFSAIESVRTVNKYAKNWPEHSGSHAYPVPSPSTYEDAESCYYKCAYHDNKMWTGEYGAARMRLLNYLIRNTR